MVPTADTKISRNIEEEAMPSKGKAETVVETSAVAEAEITVQPEGLSTNGVCIFVVITTNNALKFHNLRLFLLKINTSELRFSSQLSTVHSKKIYKSWKQTSTQHV